jgi:FixJ family two-component response regulator
MNEAAAVVFVVDDDPIVCTSMKRLIHILGLEVQTFSSAKDFLRAKRPDGPGCLVLDVRMPDLSGLDLQRELAEANVDLPIVFVTGHADVPMSVRAMKAGAVEFLTKPFREQDLLEAIQHGIVQHRAAREQRAAVGELQERVNSLTPREREVFPLVVSGLLNKQIADQLGASEKTIKIHRAQLMRKMRAESLADLVRMSERLKLTSLKSYSVGTKAR